MTISLTVALVVVAGSIDQDASRAAFNTALLNHIAAKETEDTQIAEAVHAVFDQYKGASLNMPAVCSMTAQRLNAQPENYKTLTERIADYVRANSQGPKAEDGTFANPTSIFVIAKGKGGGVFVRADRPAKDAE